MQSPGPLEFWLAAAGMIAVALAFVLPRLLLRRAPAPGASAREAVLSVHRDAWDELERERAAGRLTQEEFEQARDELGERALAELGEVGTAARAEGRAPRVAAVVALALPLAAVGLYVLFGNPGAVDGVRGFERLAGEVTARNAPAFREQLARHLAANPGDGRAWVYLGRLELALERFPESAAAFEQAVATRKVALDPAVWCDYADALGMAQGGRLAGRPAELVRRALDLAPDHPRALEMAGSVAIERGDYALAVRHWRRLLAQLPPGGAQHRELATAIRRAESLSPGSAAG